MPRVVDPAKLAHASKLYASGKTFKECAAEVGMDPDSLRVALKRRGVIARARSERPGNRPRIEPPSDRNIVADYLAGMPEYAIARQYGVARNVVRRWLTEAGVQIRGRSEAGQTRQDQLTPEQRSANAAAAHAAVRGVRRSEESCAKTAIARQRAGYGGRPGQGHEAFCSMLEDRGAEYVRELAVGRYNVDVALSAYPVAVEVLGGNWHSHKAIHRVRTPYILDRGWNLVFVWDLKRCQISAEAADYVIAFAEQTRIDPPVIGQYRVIRGDGELFAAGHADDDDFPLVRPSVRGLNVRSGH